MVWLISYSGVKLLPINRGQGYGTKNLIEGSDWLIKFALHVKLCIWRMVKGCTMIYDKGQQTRVILPEEVHDCSITVLC